MPPAEQGGKTENTGDPPGRPCLTRDADVYLRTPVNAESPPLWGGLSHVEFRAATYSPTATDCSTIGAGGLNFRVRDEIGCGPSAQATRKLKFPGNNREVALDTGGVGGEMGRVPTLTRTEHGVQASRPISTGQLNALLRVHFRPINLVVYEGPLETCV